MANTSFAAGLGAVFFAVTAWGLQLPIAKDAFAVLDPFHMTTFRYGVSAGCLALVLYLREGRRAFRYEHLAAKASVLGLVGMFASPTLVFVGMSWSRAEHAAVIVALQPAIAVLALWLLRGHRPQGFTLLFIILAFVGVVLVVTKGQLTAFQSSQQLAGDLLALLGAACWVVYSLGTPGLSRWSTWRITVLTMIPGVIATALTTCFMVGIGYVTIPTPATLWTVRGELFYLTIIGVLFALLAWNFGNARVGAVNATLLINFMPVVTFAYRTFQGASFVPVELLGVVLVVTALISNNLYFRLRHV